MATNHDPHDHDQHGAYLIDRLVRRMGRYPVQAAIQHGRLRRLWPRVLADADRATDLPTRAAGALLLLGPRSAIAGPTAARLHGCTALPDGDVHALIPYGHAARNRPGLVVHNGSCPDDDVVMRDGLRLLSVERVTADLLCTARPRDAIAVTDEMLAAQPAQWREEFRARVVRRLARRADPRGTRRGARLLGLATGRAESPPESWLLLEVVDLGFPVPEANWSICSPAGVELYRLDLAWPDHRIALEYYGYEVHTGREAEDERRIADLRRRGWIVVVATAADLSDNGRLARQLASAFERRGCAWARV